MLTSKTLSGVWCFVPLPWNENDRLDEDALCHNLEYLCSTGVAGLYTLDSSGEFFTLEYDEFFRVIDLVTKVVKPTGMPLQIGCTWSDTRGALKRAERAVEAGADAIRFAFPYWEPMTRKECFQFVKELSKAVGKVPLIHYNNSNTKVVFSADDYRGLLQETDGLVGTKVVSGDPIALVELVDKVPELSHFVGEYSFVQGMAMGARGMYSWLAAANPQMAVRWHEYCCQGDWSSAIDIQQKVIRYKTHVKLHWHGHSDAAVNKADAAVNPNLRGGLRVRGPYTYAIMEDVELARKWAETNFPELLEL